MHNHLGVSSLKISFRHTWHPAAEETLESHLPSRPYCSGLLDKFPNIKNKDAVLLMG